MVLVAGTGITTVLALAYNVYAGRVLGRVDYGDFAAVLSAVALCQIALGPINGTVARFAAQYATTGALGRVRSLWREVNRRVAKYALLGVAVGAVAAVPLASLLRLSSVWSVILGVAIVYVTLMLAVSRGALRGLQAFGPLNVNTITEAAVRLAAGVMLLTFWCHTTVGLSAYLVALVVVLVLARAQLARLWSGFDFERVDGAAVRRFTGPLLVMTITAAGIRNMDMLAAKRFVLEADAGLYAAAFTLSRTVSGLVTPFTTFLLPLLTQLHTAGHGTRGTLFRTCGYFLLLAAVPVALFAIWPERIVRLLYSSEFATAGALLLPLTLTRLFTFLSHMIALAFAATDSFRFLWVYVTGMVVEFLILLIWHESTAQIANISLITQGATFIALLVFLIISEAAPRSGGVPVPPPAETT